MTANEMELIPPQHFWGNVDIMDLYWLIWDCSLLLETVGARRTSGGWVAENSKCDLANYPVLYLTPTSIQVTRCSFAVEDSLVAVR